MLRFMTDDEYEFLKKVIANVDESWMKLSKFEKDFMESIIDREREYKDSLKLSPKQWAVIADIAEKIL